MSKKITRKSRNRLEGYDYSKPGFYFATICTEDRKCILGDVINDEIVLSEYGKICQQHLIDLSEYSEYIKIDTYVVMPNHVHAIIVIDYDNFHEFKNNGQALGLSLQAKNISLSKVIRDFKSFSSREINKTIRKDKVDCHLILFKWQRSFYDHIIRSESFLKKIRQYIQSNPATWDKDENNILT